MKDKFNKYCAEVMGYTFTHCNGKNVVVMGVDVYNPYEDRGQMAEVVLTLIRGDTISAEVFGSIPIVGGTLKQVGRDFIISTMSSEDEDESI